MELFRTPFVISLSAGITKAPDTSLQALYLEPKSLSANPMQSSSNSSLRNEALSTSI
ncbi:hypothetical protein [Peribacillus sp. SCS-155]|uniref:hypothetical protein n=1 Tax=Peribacillus sedimenti TaxID=3115297 RepID=UPI0039067DA8